MKALLEQQGLAAALEELPATTIVAYDNVIQKRLIAHFVTYFSHASGKESQSVHIDEFHKLKMMEAMGDGGEGLYVRGRSGLERYERVQYSAWTKVTGKASDSNEDQVSDSRADGMIIDEYTPLRLGGLLIRARTWDSSPSFTLNLQKIRGRKTVFEMVLTSMGSQPREGPKPSI
ncbi:hypothetical protein Tco_0085358 [Tanacetum coccineum]